MLYASPLPKEIDGMYVFRSCLVTTYEAVLTPICRDDAIR